jgi:hypothetical protein
MNTKRENELLDLLYETIVDLINDLNTIFTSASEQGDLIVVELFYKRLHKNMIMKRVIKNILPYKEYITKRDINFFRDNQFIFNSLPEDRFGYYRDIIIQEQRLTKEDMKVLWDYLDVIITLAEEFNNNS